MHGTARTVTRHVTTTCEILVLYGMARNLSQNLLLEIYSVPVTRSLWKYILKASPPADANFGHSLAQCFFSMMFGVGFILPIRGARVLQGVSMGPRERTPGGRDEQSVSKF